MKETLKTEQGEENRRRGGGIFHLILCIALVVTCSIYLNNLNQTIDYSSTSFECVPNILPPSLIDDCRHVGQWKSYAILGIIRGSFYILQIIGQIICWFLFQPGKGNPSDPKSGPKCGFLLSLISLAISLAISIIPIYLAINLVRTSAIYSTADGLKNPAIATFAFCMVEVIGLLIQLICITCVAVGVTSSCIFCCVYCRKENDATGPRVMRQNELKGETKPMNLESVTVSK